MPPIQVYLLHPTLPTLCLLNKGTKHLAEWDLISETETKQKRKTGHDIKTDMKDVTPVSVTKTIVEAFHWRV